MKGNLLLFLIVFISINCYSQISFEKGYFINNSDQKVDCYIMDIDWRSNPLEFEYKLSVDDESKIASINTVKEFGIYNSSKYVRKVVEIDKASDNVKDLNEDKNPIFKEEELFLKVLIEGNANLYVYQSGNSIRYFYNVENSDIKQLIYKRYLIKGNKIGENNHFRQQLWNSLNCATFKRNTIKNLKYKKRELTNLFVEYNQCMDSDVTSYFKVRKKDLINITARPRFNSSALMIKNNMTNGSEIDFGNKSSFGFGVEAEYILPFNKNKWSISIEPTYQYYKNVKTVERSNVSGGKIIAEIDYKSIEIPFNLRHYLYLNDNSKIFANISYVIDTNFKSSIELLRVDNSTYESLEINTTNVVAFGIGYKYNDNYSVELRYLSNREILNSYSFWQSEYQNISIIIGYSIF